MVRSNQADVLYLHYPLPRNESGQAWEYQDIEESKVRTPSSLITHFRLRKSLRHYTGQPHPRGGGEMRPC